MITCITSSVGLVLTIDTDIGEYVKALAVEEGIRVLVADQDVGLFPYEEGFSVPPGVIASIGISKVSPKTISY